MSSRATRHKPAAAPAARIRIIGGEWRGRRLAVAEAPSLRPTPDRVRETLFNWLSPRIAGARCLDLFAGTGALGFEALSRGAAHVRFVEHNPAAAGAIRDALDGLDARDRGDIVRADALDMGHDDADIVFIDPPFGAGLHGAALAAVAGALAPDARLYLEYPATAAADIGATLAAHHEILRSARAGRVGYCLACRAMRGEHGPP